MATGLNGTTNQVGRRNSPQDRVVHLLDSWCQALEPYR